jgi:hypothetical protein
MECLIPITAVIGAGLLARSATAAPGLDGGKLKSGTVSWRALSRTVCTELGPASAPARLGAVGLDVAVSASGEVVRRRGRRQGRAGSARPRGECRAGSDWRRVREIGKEIGQLLGLHRRQAMRLTDLHRVELLGDLIPTLVHGSRSARSRSASPDLRLERRSRGVAGRDRERGGPRHTFLNLRQRTAHPAGLRFPCRPGPRTLYD